MGMRRSTIGLTQWADQRRGVVKGNFEVEKQSVVVGGRKGVVGPAKEDEATSEKMN